jgi:predicted negative regulator of RcsB-dependent stress response
MNAERRKSIQQAIELCKKAEPLLRQIYDLIESVEDDEQESYDNLAESFQTGEQGQRMEEVLGYLEEAKSEIEALNLDSIVESLENAL